MLFHAARSPAASGVWTNSANGNWSGTVNWLNATVADGADATADFSTTDLTAARTVTLDGSHTLGNLIFGDITASHDWTVSKGSSPNTTITLSVSSGTPTITVTNQSVTFGNHTTFAGAQGLIKAGSGTLNFGGDTANTYSGTTVVNEGTLACTKGSSSLICIPGAAVINSGGTLDLGPSSTSGDFIANTATVTVTTNGTLQMQNRGETIATLVLDGGTITGGSSRNLTLTTPIDARSGTVNYNLAGAVGLNKTTAGTLWVSKNCAYSGDTRLGAGTLTLLAGGALSSTTLDANPADSGTLSTDSNSPFNVGGLKGSRDLLLVNTNGGGVHLRIGNNNQTTTYSGNLGPGSSTTLEKLGTGALYLDGTNSCGVIVQAGTLGGNGTFTASFDLAGGRLSPGHSIGSMSMFSLSASGGTMVMEIDKAANTNDFINCSSSLAYAGTLAISNLTDALAAGDQFKLFNAASYSGSFSNITPSTPGANLLWDASSLTNDGTLKVVGAPVVSPQPRITSLVVAGVEAILAGTNGPATSNYLVLSSTDISLAPSNWTILQTNQFDALGNFNCTNAYTVETARFYIIQVP